ncbi:hypothetical protein [Sphingosinicella sp. YJ22]|uniref:hypothetical protein n=1 Tax=Sphingosinicella sp. YJ22 TaxID=1104780 RepID=UPI00140B1AC4|nr:hypothetical protein [Sphingosinicella sp. YJ22]
MASYYVNDNAQPNGDHEVHVSACAYFPSNRTYLGEYGSCAPAVAEARKTWSQSNGCYHCCRPCHTS